MEQSGGVDFLGDHFTRRYRRPRQKSLRKSKDAVLQKTRRTNGHSLAVIIANVNRTRVGWFAYFKHSQGSLEDLGAWIRTRLRSILRKRTGFRRRRRTADNLCWPVRFFAAQGLLSLRHA